MWLVICVGVGEQLLCKAQEWLAHEAAAAAEGTDNVIADTAENGVHVVSMQMNCYMWKMLVSQQDFMNKKPLIQIVIKKVGHVC